MIEITIPGKPIAKKRPRFARVGKFVKTYNAQETEEGRWILEAKEQLSEPPIPSCHGVALKLEFMMPRPKGHYGTGRNAGKLKPSAPKLHLGKPDIDNLEKFAMDCLKGLAWDDDCQVVSVHSTKYYPVNSRPGTKILISIYEG